MAELLGSLLVRLGLESGAFKSGLTAAEKEFRAAQKRIEKIGQSMADAGKKLSLGVTLPLVAIAAKAVQGAQEQAAAMGQVEAALKSMGDASGKTAGELAKAADAMEMRSLFAADEILTKVSANLLTFGNIAGEQFDRAQQAAIDMATRMGSDPQSAAIMLGKALNDPIKGISALSKVGVQLTEAQKKQIQSFVATGQAAKAQGIILGEVEKQFGGAAQAAADTQPWRQAQVAIDQAMDKIGEAILPVIPVITDAIASIASAFADLSPEMAKAIVIGGAVAAALGPFLVVAGSIVKIAAPLAAALTTTAAASTAAGAAAGGASVGFAALAAAAAPWIAGAAAIGAAGYLIYQNWDKIAPVLEEVWDSLTSTIGPPLMSLISAVSDAFSALWNGPLGSIIGTVGAMLLDAFGGALPGVLQVLGSLIGGVFNLIADSIRLVVAILSGDWAGAWEAAKDLVGNAVSAIGGVIEGLGTAIGSWVTAAGKAVGVDVPAAWDKAKQAATDGAKVMSSHMQSIAALARGDFAGAWQHAKDAVSSFGKMIGVDFGLLKNTAVAAMQQLYSGVRDWLQVKLGATLDWLAGKLKWAGDLFFQLYDRVVGHSYIPDMVDEIGKHMARLDNELVEPVKKATGAAGEAFRKLQTDVSNIFARLFPEQAAAINFENELGTLNRYFDTLIKRGGEALAIVRQRVAAVTALRREYSGWDAYVDEQASAPIEAVPGTVPIEEGNDQILEKVGVAFGKVGENAKAMQVQVVESFAQMVDGAMRELDRLLSGIKSGNVLDIIGGLLSAIEKIGGIVSGNSSWNIGNLFGGSGTPSIAGARAKGGPVQAGRSYLVGEEGEEIFTPRVSGRIIPNGGPSSLQQPTSRVEIVDTTGLFRFRVDEQIMQAAPAVAKVGSDMGQQGVQRSQQRRLA